MNPNNSLKNTTDLDLFDILSKYCDFENDEQKGLFLLDLPTGFGKTYNTLKYISDVYKKNTNKKIVFLTNYKKNLPHEELRKKFFENRENEFNQNVLFIDSNKDCVMQRLFEEEKFMPSEIISSSEFKKLKEDIRFLESVKSRTDKTTKDIVAKIEEQLFKENEPKFRYFLMRKLTDAFGNNKDAKLDAITEKSEWKWVGRLYPSVFTSRRQILFLSIDKFLLKNAEIVAPSYNFLEADFLKGALVFIDEFDATKSILMKKIIEDNIANRIDIIGLFLQLYASLNTLTIPSMYQAQKSIDELVAKAKEIKNDYDIQLSIKTRNPEYKKNFLFDDGRFMTITKDNDESYIALTKDTVNKIHYIDFVSRENSKEIERPTILELISKIKSFIVFFEQHASKIAGLYQKEQNKECDTDPMKQLFSWENSLRSLFNELQLKEEYQKYLLNNIAKQNLKFKIRKTIFDRTDMAFYNYGYRYYDFEDQERHNTQSKIQINACDTTPEKMLLQLCKTSFVVGISATAKIPTVLGNYDLSYLKERLEEENLFYDITDVERNTLKQQFEIKNKEIYQNSQINVEIVRKGNLETELGLLFQKSAITPLKLDIIKDECFHSPEAKARFQNLYIIEQAETDERTAQQQQQELVKTFTTRIGNKINNESNDKFHENRYIKLAKVFKLFIENQNAKALLYFSPKLPRENDVAFDLNLIKEICNTIASQNNCANYKISVLKTDGFEVSKENIFAGLKQGEKAFVITSYPTLGAGQNIQYETIDNIEKDFDSIYVEKPSHLLVNTTRGASLDMHNLNKRIFQVEMLHENSEITRKNLNFHIRDVFQKAYYTSIENNLFELYGTKSYYYWVCKEIIQAIGRIARTKNKNNEITIYIDEELSDSLNHFDKKNFILIPEFEKVLDKIRLLKNAPAESKSNEEIEIDKINTRAKTWIEKRAHSQWLNKADINDWQALREMVLKNPTLSKEDYESTPWKIFYIPLPKPGNQYSFSSLEDFMKVEIDFTNNKASKVSSDAVNLSKLLSNIKLLSDFFEEKGYATEWINNDYIIAPIVFQNIYKGGLGEVIGKFILEYYLSQPLEDLPQSIFEKFDYVLPNSSIFIDFKFWNENKRSEHTDKEMQYSKIQRKIEKTKAQHVFIINILANFDWQPIKTHNVTIIPFLVREDTYNVDTNTLNNLKQTIFNLKQSNDANQSNQNSI